MRDSESYQAECDKKSQESLPVARESQESLVVLRKACGLKRVLESQGSHVVSRSHIVSRKL